MITFGSFQRLIRIFRRIQDGFQFEFLLTYFHAFVSDDGLTAMAPLQCVSKRRNILKMNVHIMIKHYFEKIWNIVYRLPKF